MSNGDRPLFDLDGDQVPGSGETGTGPGKGQDQGPGPLPPGGISRYFKALYEFDNPTTGILWEDAEPYIQGSTYKTWASGRPLPTNDISQLGLDVTDISLFGQEVWDYDPLIFTIPGIVTGTYTFRYYSSDGVTTDPVGFRTVDLDIQQGQHTVTGVIVTIGNHDAVMAEVTDVVVADSGDGTGTFTFSVIPNADVPNICAFALIGAAGPPPDTRHNFPSPYTSTAGRDWNAGEPFLQGIPGRYLTPAQNLPTNDLTAIYLEADEVALFNESNVGAEQGSLVFYGTGWAPGQYTLYLWLHEPEHTAVGQRVLEYVRINGVTFAQGLDIYATALFTTNRGNDAIVLVQNFSVAANALLTIEIKATTGAPIFTSLAALPRASGQATYIAQNCGFNASGQPFEFTDSNGLIWRPDQDLDDTGNVVQLWLGINPIENLAEFGYTVADEPLFQARTVGYNAGAGGTTKYLDYNLTIEGGFRYQIGFTTHEMSGGDRRIRVLWNGQIVVDAIPATQDNYIGVGFGWLDLLGVTGPQAGVLRFEDDERGTINDPLICGFWVIEETVEPPGRVTQLQVNAGGAATRNFPASTGETWVADPAYLDDTVVQSQRYTLGPAVTGLTEVGFTASDVGLFQDLRYSTDVPLAYSFSLESKAQWCLRLIMTEDANSGNTIGGRVMDVYANGIQIAAGIDPLALAGGTYHHAVEYQCALVDLRNQAEDFVVVNVEIRQAPSATGLEPYPMIAGLQWTRQVLTWVREQVVDAAGDPRADQTGLAVFIWEVQQQDPLILGQNIVQTTAGTTDASGYLEVNLPTHIQPGDDLMLAVSNAADADDLNQWSFFGRVLAKVR